MCQWTGSQSAYPFGQILFWVCLWRCFWMRLTFELLDLSKVDCPLYCGWASSNQLKVWIGLVWGLHNGVCQPHSPCSGEHAPFKLLPLHQESEHVRFWVIHYKWSLCFLKLSIKPHLPSNQAFLGLVFPVQENHAGDWGWGSPVWVSDPSLFGKNICSCDYCLFCGLPNLAFGSWLDCCSYLSYCVSFFISWVVESFFC